MSDKITKTTAASLMPQIDAYQLKGVIKHVMLMQNKIPLVWGQSGIGKTEIISQALEEAGAVICDVRAGQQDTVDIRGIPIHDRNPASPTFGQTIWMPPSMLPIVGNDQWPDDRPIGLVLDEINQGMPGVLGGLYQLMQERRYGEFILKSNVRICAMANPESSRGITNRMPLPLLYRTVQYEMVVNVQTFCEYAISQGVPTWLVAFWLSNLDAVHNFNVDAPAKLIACPRTWFNFADFVNADMPEDIRTVSCMGAVGKGVATEALAFREVEGRVPTIKAIMADPARCFIPTETSLQYMITVKISSVLSTKTASKLYTYLKRMPSMFVILAWTMAGKRDESLTTTPEFIDFGVRYRDVFRASAD